MYIPVQNDGCPADGVWMVLLREVVEGSVGAFQAGKVTRLEIRSGEKGCSISIRCDGVVSRLNRWSPCAMEMLRCLINTITHMAGMGAGVCAFECFVGTFRR